MLSPTKYKQSKQVCIDMLLDDTQYKSVKMLNAIHLTATESLKKRTNKLLEK